MALDKVHLSLWGFHFKNMKLVQTSPELPVFVLINHHSSRSAVPQGGGAEGGATSSRSRGGQGHSTQGSPAGKSSLDGAKGRAKAWRWTTKQSRVSRHYLGYREPSGTPTRRPPSLLLVPNAAACVRSQATTASAPSPVQLWLEHRRVSQRRG